MPGIYPSGIVSLIGIFIDKTVRVRLVDFCMPRLRAA